MVQNQKFYLMFVLGLAPILLLAMEFPRLLGFYPALFSLGMAAWWTCGQKQHLPICRPYLSAVAAISGFILLSCLWSIEPMDAFQKASLTSFMLCVSAIFFSLCRSLSYEKLRPYLWIFPVGMIAACLFCSFEIAANLPVYRIIRQPEHIINSAVMNRGIIFSILCFFPVLRTVHIAQYAPKTKYALYGGMALSMLLTLYLTQSQSAQLAFIAGGLFYLAYPYKSKNLYTIMAGTIAAALLLTPLMSQLLLLNFFYDFMATPWLKDGYAAHRLEIWDFVSRYAMQNPLYGFGFEATRFVKEFDHDYVIHKQATVLHPHNFAVQIWIEFGAIGALAASAAITSILYKIRNAPLPDARTFLPLFMTVLSVATTGYGIWQGWWLGAIFFALGLSALPSGDSARKPDNNTIIHK